VLSLVVVGLSVFLILELFKTPGAYVSVTVDGGESHLYPLEVDGEYSLNGGTNVLVIKDGKAYMSHADCPDKVCVNSGRISYTGEKIICLPNKVFITVVGAEEEVLQ
jgi:hypothetical protein